jgi:hypothetical protein
MVFAGVIQSIICQNDTAKKLFATPEISAAVVEVSMHARDNDSVYALCSAISSLAIKQRSGKKFIWLSRNS